MPLFVPCRTVSKKDKSAIRNYGIVESLTNLVQHVYHNLNVAEVSVSSRTLCKGFLNPRTVQHTRTKRATKSSPSQPLNPTAFHLAKYRRSSTRTPMPYSVQASILQGSAIAGELVAADLRNESQKHRQRLECLRRKVVAWCGL